MPVGFGGGPPLLSLLTGAAKGITEAQARQEERKRQAILDSLREAANRRAEDELRLAKRKQAVAEQQQAIAAARQLGLDTEKRNEAQAKAKAAAEQAAADREMISRRVDELTANGVQPMAAILQARREVGDKTNPIMPTGPEQPDPVAQEADRLRNVRLRQQIKDSTDEQNRSAAETAILNDPTLATALERSTSREEALQAIEGMDLPEGVQQADILRAWEEHGGKPERPDSGPPSGDIPAMARSRVVGLLNSAASQQHLDLSDPEIAQSTADQLLQWVVQQMSKANQDGTPMSPGELRMFDEMRKVLVDLTTQGYDSLDKLRELKLGPGWQAPSSGGGGE